MFTPETIQQFEKTPTPFYHYDINVLEQTLSALKKEADRYNYMYLYS